MAFLGNYGDGLYWAPGRREEAALAYRRAISLGEAKLQVNPRDATLLAFLATYNAMLGKKEMAFRNVGKENEPNVFLCKLFDKRPEGEVGGENVG